MLSKPKKPSLPYFTPDRRQCLIIGNIDYSAIRWPALDANGNKVTVEDENGNPKEKEKGFADLPEV